MPGEAVRHRKIRAILIGRVQKSLNMRVLYFSPRVCWPMISGAHLRDFYLARQLAGRAILTYIGLDSGKSRTPASALRESPELLSGAEILTIPRDPSYRPANLVRGLIGPIPLNVLNFTSAAVMAELERILQDRSFDAIQIESVHLIAYARRIRQLCPRARLICDWHNIESEILTRYAERESNPLRALYARRTAALSRRMESQFLCLGHAHTVCSEREREILLQRVPQARIEVVGNGVDVEYFAASPTQNQVRRDLVFVGRMDYHANIDAALFFAKKIWPLVRARRPELRFVVVGAQPTSEVLALRDLAGVTVTGTVDDVRPFYHSALAAVVPLRVGGGTRLKVLEAMAAGTPVISTTLGAEGLAVTAGKDILVADSSEAIADTIASLQEDTPEWQSLITNARTLVQTQYDWSVIGKVLARLYAEQLDIGTTCLDAGY
jgi:polysaccharide biosynthesis protein PslH